MHNVSISVVIPTCNRKQRLLALLASLSQTTYEILEVIVVDSGEDQLSLAEIEAFKKLKISYYTSIKSVCVQRNIGIRQAKGNWIFLCDDDMEVPANYLQVLVNYISEQPGTGAVSGKVLQQEAHQWVDQYPITSMLTLFWKFIFQLNIWGELRCSGNRKILRYLINYYSKKGNHISLAGWPVLTNFSGASFTTPIYGLGAALIKKEWLQNSPYDEALDQNGAGDNYGVALGFPDVIHVVNSTFVYHHREKSNRLSLSKQYYNRVLALHYFIVTSDKFSYYNRLWFFWSLFGNLLYSIGKIRMDLFLASLKAIVITMLGNSLLIKKRYSFP